MNNHLKVERMESKDKPFLYRDYVPRISRLFSSRIEEMCPIYGFDYGDEFEVALCKSFRTALPSKYEVCRGHAVSQDGSTTQGDDIIIYDPLRFPNTTARDNDEFALKNSVPIEAIYAYIEAKHTLVIEGDGGQSLIKAIEQVGRFKKIVEKRSEPEIPDWLRKSRPEIFKDSPLNPVMGCIFANRVKRRATDKAHLDDPQEIVTLMLSQKILVEQSFDLLVLGKDLIYLPTTANQRELLPFSRVDEATFRPVIVPDNAMAVGFIQIATALDTIQLAPMPWLQIR